MLILKMEKSRLVSRRLRPSKLQWVFWRGGNLAVQHMKPHSSRVQLGRGVV
jgi:hypothetical protein